MSYGKRFSFAVKLVYSALLLLLPPILAFSVLTPTYKILRKTPLYEKPLYIIHAWKVESLQKISESKEGDAVYQIELRDGRKVNIESSNKEGVYLIESRGYPEVAPKIGFVMRTNRPVKDEGERDMLKKRFFGGYLDIDEEKLSIYERPAGYKRNLAIKLGGLIRAGHVVYGVIVFITAFFSLAIFVLILEYIINFVRGKAGVVQW